MDGTKGKLIRAAERLMAARGVDNVTFAEITKAAGQRNNSAVPYYFGDRLGLLRSMLAKHTAPIADRRTSMLDQLGPTPTLRDVLLALVQPIVDEILHAVGGDDYVCILAHLVSHPELDPSELGAGDTPVNRRLNAAIVAACPPMPATVVQLRMDLMLSMLFHGLADRARFLADPTEALRSKQLFVDNFVDTLEAVLAAPPSDATLAALGRRAATGRAARAPVAGT